MILRCVHLLAVLCCSIAGVASGMALISYAWSPAVVVTRETVDSRRSGVMTTHVVCLSRARLLSGGAPWSDGDFESVDWTVGPLLPAGDPPPTSDSNSIWPALLVTLVVSAGGLLGSRQRRSAAVRGIAPGRWLRIVVGAIATCMVVAGIYAVRSYFRFERLDLALPFTHGPEAIQVNNSGGSVMVAWTRLGPNHTLNHGGFAFTRWESSPYSGTLVHWAGLVGQFEQAFGFTLGWDGGSALPRNVFIAPYWAILLALAGTLALCVHTLRRLRDRDAIDRCKRCGYDCRGLADRCPECGTAIAPARS